ncbi:AAA family ATPase, partial [Klebsiella pneumoniae]|uniref:AAA family ATPase n=1 Tax=Klebsiella pneumoniae TaxID=573 RepID=UPI00359FBF21
MFDGVGARESALRTPAMLSRLVLTDFRNHADLCVAPGDGFVVLTGHNGAGKTNVLEAVSLLTPGRGLRRAPASAATPLPARWSC